jgi:hypothetical protein
MAEQDTLLKQCEKHMSAARAHSEGEAKERQRADMLQCDLSVITSEVATVLFLTNKSRRSKKIASS